MNKKHKTFVTYGKGKIVTQGFHSEPQKSKPNQTETANASKASSEQQFLEQSGPILNTGSDVNLLGRKYLKKFAKARILYTVKEAERPLTMKGAFCA